MALQIDKERIENKELTDYEVDYLRTRGKLPADYFGETKLENQSVPRIGTSGGIIEDDEEEDYEDGWNNDQRRAELARRKLSVDGNKNDLIARLRRSDLEELEEDDYSTLDD